MSVEVVHDNTHKQLQPYVDSQEDEDVQEYCHILHKRVGRGGEGREGVRVFNIMHM